MVRVFRREKYLDDSLLADTRYRDSKLLCHCDKLTPNEILIAQGGTTHLQVRVIGPGDGILADVNSQSCALIF